MFQTHYLTKERLEELKAELHDFKTKVRAEVAERLKKAKEMGDLSENAEYSEAKDEQSRVEMRIAELENIIKNVSIIQKTANKDKVQMGSVVEVSKNGKIFKFTVVGSNEAKPEEGRISNESPLGAAFFGKKAGEEIKVKAPSGEVVYKIISIE